ncbi:MAG: aminotransferase class I/II-fold pyridoxal phosphate-dependent enzyme [Candidatus Hodarchaeales archaeon]|jgi:aspartate/methionine/tyrosine aminotransferase
MKIETFKLERIQSIWENRVKFNLTESGVHPYKLTELLSKEQIEQLLSMRIGYGQTNGSIELRETISKLYPTSDLDNVLVTNGSAEANFIAIWSLLEPGDELILMLPNYMQIWGIARSFGVVVRPFHLKEEMNWQPDIEEVRSLISPRTKMIAVCNPNNPTGAVLSQEAIEELINLAKGSNAWLYADEIYRGAELDGEETTSFYGLYEKSIVACGLSKSYALPGLRIGWLVGPKPFIEKAWSYHDYTSIASGIFSNRIATLALRPEMRMKILTRNRKMLKENLDVLLQWVEKQKGKFVFIPPKAGGMAFLRYNFPVNSIELTTKLRIEKSCLIVAGDYFGMSNYIRIGIGSEKSYFLAGLELLNELLDELTLK